MSKSRLRPSDLARAGLYGLRARPIRIVLSALGIAIGIASMVAVVGISTSSQAYLNQRLARLGTNLLKVQPGQNLATGGTAALPDTALSMVGHIIAPVTSATATGMVPHTHAYRNDHIADVQTNGVEVDAAKLNLLSTVGGTLSSGTC
ncbi:ABC transporter permease [Fodinicola feengrottensis]|uniref:ABC transporter permease n=1 Tax=Fodinicola feengrottensis TaxID=435914 RepID=UPI0024419AFE|nr:ABC transporter permease [Fodinicola feengrottensis]